MASEPVPALLRCKSEQSLAKRPEHKGERDEDDTSGSGEEAFGAELVPKAMPAASLTPPPAASSSGSASSPSTAQPAQARAAAEGKTKQQTKKALKIAAAKKALPGLSGEELASYNQCSICEEWLPLTEFPPGGGQVCSRDDLAKESLQRMLRFKWKKDYTKKFNALKKDKNKYHRSIVQHREQNRHNMRRTLQVEVEELGEVRKKVKNRKRTRKVKKWMYSDYKKHYGGDAKGYMEPQMREKWDRISADTPCDEKGTVAGRKGYKRWRVALTTTSSEAATGSENEQYHTMSKKPRKAQCVDEVEDLLAGHCV